MTKRDRSPVHDLLDAWLAAAQEFVGAPPAIGQYLSFAEITIRTEKKLKLVGRLDYRQDLFPILDMGHSMACATAITDKILQSHITYSRGRGYKVSGAARERVENALLKHRATHGNMSSREVLRECARVLVAQCGAYHLEKAPTYKMRRTLMGEIKNKIRSFVPTS